MAIDAASWPFAVVIVVAAVVILGLLPANAAALRGVLRPGSALGRGPARKRARVAWLVSFAALFSGPLAPLGGLLAAGLGLWATRAVRASEAQDPLDAQAARAATLNGAALIGLSVIVGAAVFIAGS